MPNFFPRNLEYLREQRGLKQAELATALHLKRSTYANYENGDTEPKFEIVEDIVRFFGITADALMFSNLADVQPTEKTERGENVQLNVQATVQPKGEKGYEEPEYFPLEEAAPPPVKKGSKHAHSMPKVVTIDSHGEENAVYVPVKARAGYLLGYGDAHFIQNLPAYNLPGLRNGTYRIFEVDGLSMFNTLQDKDRVIARWVQPSEIMDDRIHVLITKNDGLLIKRILNRLQEGKLICRSDNNHHGQYPNLVLDASEVLEAWYVVERWTRHLPSPGEIYKRIVDLEADMAIIKQKLGKA